MIEDIHETYPDEEILKANGFNEAVIGIDEKSMRLVYSVSKCIEILEADMTTEEAMEFFNFNVFGAEVGNKTPIWCWDGF